MEATLRSETIVTTQRLQVITGQKAVIILTAVPVAVWSEA
jgi:hypothetical protein